MKPAYRVQSLGVTRLLVTNAMLTLRLQSYRNLSGYWNPLEFILYCGHILWHSVMALHLSAIPGGISISWLLALAVFYIRLYTRAQERCLRADDFTTFLALASFYVLLTRSYRC